MTRQTIALLLTILVACMSTQIWAQPSTIKHRDRLGDSVILKDINDDVMNRQVKPKPKMNSITFGPAIYTDGLGLMVNYNRSFGSEQFGQGKEETFHHSHFLQLEISERYHSKEFRPTGFSYILASLLVQESNFMYGKVNNLYNVRLNYGQRRLFGGRGEPHSPLIQAYASVGFNAFLVKPYYIKVFGGRTIKYSEDTERDFLLKEAIEGKAGFTKGLNEMQIVGAANVRAGFYMDVSKKTKRISAFDIGIGIDYAFSEVNQIVNVAPSQFFFNAYVAYQWGKKF